MFPPPIPWKQRAVVDPEREYVAFTSRFFMKSLGRVPAFVAHSIRIMKQANVAPGIVGWSLGSDLFKLEFHTLSVWEDADSLRRFVRDGDHRAALEQFEQDVRRKSIFVYYRVIGRDLPPTWKDAIARQENQDRA
jgi:hypothetical protein